MLIAVLLFTQTAVDKLAGHSITPEEVREVNDGDRVAIRNPHPRVAESILLIGPTHGGRILTVVLDPEPSDAGAWHVRTGWPASSAQRAGTALPTRPVIGHDGAVSDDDITSAELDDLLDEAETIYVGRTDGPTEMRLFVAVDAETFRVLEQRAAKAGTVVTAAASEALRRGARVA